MTFSRCYP